MTGTEASTGTATLTILSRLRQGADRAAYERWAAEVDRPAVLAMPSIDDWRLDRVERVLGGDVDPLYDYVEIAAVGDLAQLERDLGSEAAAALTEALLEYCEPPTFLLTERVA